MVRFWTLLNSYITVVTSPGWTSTERFSGWNSHGPAEFASNSIVMVRLASTWVLRATSERSRLPSASVSDSDSTLMPSALQMVL